MPDKLSSGGVVQYFVAGRGVLSVKAFFYICELFSFLNGRKGFRRALRNIIEYV